MVFTYNSNLDEVKKYDGSSTQDGAADEFPVKNLLNFKHCVERIQFIYIYWPQSFHQQYWSNIDPTAQDILNYDKSAKLFQYGWPL